MSVLILLVCVLTGCFVVRLAWPNRLAVCRHDVLRLSLGAGVGLAIASVVTFIADAVFGGSAGFTAAADVLLLAASGGSYYIFRRSVGCPFCLASTPSGQETAHKPETSPTLVWVAAGLALLSALVAFGLFTASNPHGEWDAWATWNNHARFLASGSSWKQMFAPQLVWSVQDYPLLVPGAIANAWMVAGGRSTLVPAIVAAIFLFGAAGVLFGALDILRGRTQALVAVTTLFGAAMLMHMAATQYADVPLGFFYLAAAAVLCVGGPHSYWLAGLTAACAAWTKNEGLVFLAVVFASQLLAGGKRIAMMAAGAAPVAAVVLWFKLVYAPSNYMFAEQQPLASRLGDVSRYMAVVVEFGKQMFTFGGWLLPPVVVVAAYLWLMGRSERDGPNRFAALITLMVMTFAYAGVYVFSTKDVNWQIETSLSRVLMQLWPMAVLVLFLYAAVPVPVQVPKASDKSPKRARQK